MKLGKIKIEYFQDPLEIVITADANGLRYLSEVCQKAIGKQGPAAHWHLSPDIGSIDTRICFIEK